MREEERYGESDAGGKKRGMKSRQKSTRQGRRKRYG
jgi:hypothetical protein